MPWQLQKNIVPVSLAPSTPPKKGEMMGSDT